MLSAMEVEALQKEWEDAIGDTKDAQREAEEEQFVVAMAENVWDTAQAEVARLRAKLEGTGHSPFPSLPSTDTWSQPMSPMSI